MKTAISIPDDVFRRAERAAKRLGVSRSELFTRAVREFLETERSAALRTSYDAAFGPGAEQDDEAFRRETARRTLSRIEW